MARTSKRSRRRYSIDTRPRSTSPSEDLVERYVCGSCMYLATALSRRLGWPIEALTYSAKDPPSMRGVIQHAWVVEPKSGLVIDLYGVRARKDVLDEYGGDPEDVERMSEAVLRQRLGESVAQFEPLVAEADRVVDEFLLPKITRRKSR